MSAGVLSKTDTLTDWLNGRVTVPFVQTLNKKMKRLVAIASLFGYIFNKSERNKGVEERLSKIMNLTENSSSITLPLVYHDLIWSPIERKNKIELLNVKSLITQKIKEGMTRDAAQKCAELLISILPAYLIYDSVDNIRQDVEHLFESLPFILEDEISSIS